jgi:2-phospho-L-lactate guanylyltransferase
MPQPPTDWRIVVPVKDQGRAKSRLHPPDGVVRAALAHAFALDTLSVVFATMPPAHVVVVSSDLAIRTFAEARGARVEADPADGLNPALRQGLRRVSQEPWGGRTGLLLGDLPALRPEDLAQALATCATHPRSVVPDATGEGTVLLTAQRPDDLEPRFGPGSARAHGDRAHRLELVLPSLRTDVDDDESLTAACALGLGPHTLGVLAGRR